MRIKASLIDENHRKSFPGSFIHLPGGWTHYELCGESQAPLVVFIHGFSAPMFIWDPTFASLTAAGFQVLRFDLFGRGYSDRPKEKYTAKFFDDQIINLLGALGLESRPLYVFGLSMGGAIAINFCCEHPNKVKKLVLIDPAGFPMEHKPYPAILKVPGLNRILFRALAPKLLLSKVDQDFQDPAKFPNFKARYAEQFQYRGYFEAILSTILHFPLETAAPLFAQVGKTGLPILLFWGKNDTTVPYPIHEKVVEVLPNAEFHAISDAAHLPHIDQEAIVNPLILTFVKSP